MSIDCIESAGESADVFDSDDSTNELSTSSLWNGRSVELIIERDLKLEQISHFYIVALQQIDALNDGQIRNHHYDLLDLTEAIFEEISLNFDQYVELAYLFAVPHSLNREFTLADPTRYQADILQCRNIFKSAVKGVKKCSKKALKGVKKGVEAVADFVKEHKKEILIGAAIVAAATGAYLIAGALTGSAGAVDGSGKKREDEEDPEITPPPSDPLPNNEDVNRSANEMTTEPSSSAVDSASQSAYHNNALIQFFENLRNGKIDPSSQSTFDLTYKSDPQQNNEDINKSANEMTTEPSSSAVDSASQSAYHNNTLIQFFENLRSGKIDPSPQSTFDLTYKSDSQEDNAIAAPSASPPAASPLQSTIATFLESLQRNIIEQNAQSLFDKSHQPMAMSDASSPVENPSATAPLQSAISSFLETLGSGANATSTAFAASLGGLPVSVPFPFSSEGPMKSCHIQTEGIRYPGVRIGVINGMNTSFAAHKNHLYDIKRFAGDMSIDGVYNHSNTPFIDSLEIFVLNYEGFAPVTADLLLENWTQFHEENRDNPDAKYLQFTHSMGTIQAKDALLSAPQEIRDRVIIVAIGPAVIIPEWLCYKSFHYASKKDWVHYGENFYTLILAGFNDESEQAELVKQLFENKQQLILLDPHPDAKGWDHDFESPTFDEIKEYHIKLHCQNEGIYR